MDEPIRYNEGKVDWTLLPWDRDMIFDLSHEIRGLSRRIAEDQFKNFLFISLQEVDIPQLLCFSLLLNDKQYHSVEESICNLPWNALEQVCRVFMYAIETKYQRDNYKIAPGLPLETYIQSMWRHTVSYLKGEELDIDSGLPNLAHLACNCFMYLWTQKEYHSTTN